MKKHNGSIIFSIADLPQGSYIISSENQNGINLKK